MIRSVAILQPFLNCDSCSENVSSWENISVHYFPLDGQKHAEQEDWNTAVCLTFSDFSRKLGTSVNCMFRRASLWARILPRVLVQLVVRLFSVAI